MLARFTASISVSTGFEVTEFRQLLLASMALAAVIFLLSLVVLRYGMRRTRPELGPTAGIAGYLTLVSSSHGLLNIFQSLKDIDAVKEKKDHLRRSDVRCEFQKVGAPHLTGGERYGLEVVRRSV